MQNARKKFQKSFKQKIRNLKSTKPKQYGKLLNSNKQNKNNTLPNLTSSYDHFKTLNKNSDNPEISINNNTCSEPDLDKEFSDEEILLAIKTLKENKATGNDDVLNEYICSTINILLPIFISLFNYILMSGNIPEKWVIGNIISVYKNKGDRSSPENYRGMSLLSCFGKYFTSLINTRLTNFSNSNKVLLENQTGFRRGYSTMDYVFTLKSLIDIFLHWKINFFVLLLTLKKRSILCGNLCYGSNYFLLGLQANFSMSSETSITTSSHVYK